MKLVPDLTIEEEIVDTAFFIESNNGVLIDLYLLDKYYSIDNPE